MKKKIIEHIGAITSFLVGSIFTHQSFNAIEYDKILKKNVVKENLEFFGIKINRVAVFDIGMSLMGLGFFSEFYQTFKPLEYKEIKKKV